MKRWRPSRWPGGLDALSPAFCGGLIEARSVRQPDTQTARLSPAFCGGLIEALHPALHALERSTLSPAFCGGLIEAGAGAAAGAAAGATFPRVLRGPH